MVRASLAVLITSAILISSREARAAHELDAGTRLPFALLMVSPNEATRVSALELSRFIAEQLAANTDFAILELDARAEATITCRGSLQCLAAAARRELADALNQHPALLLIVTNVPQGAGERDRLSAELVDTEVGATLAKSAGQASELAEARSWFGDVLERELRPVLERAGRWKPFGTIVLRGVKQNGLEITVDGRVAGTTQIGENILHRAPAGTRELALAGPEIKKYTARVQVEKQKTIELDVVTEELTWVGPKRMAVIGGGLAAFALGAVFTGLAIGESVGADQYCLRIKDGPEGCREGTSFATLGSGGDAMSFSKESGGIPAGPLGVGLIGLGASWAIGSYIFAEKDEFPWLPVVIGLGILGASYGVGLAVNDGP